MNQPRRLRMGDTCSERPGLVFYANNGRFQKWVTPEKLQEIKARAKTPERKAWVKRNRMRPEVAAQRKVEYGKAKERGRQLSNERSTRYRRGEAHPSNPELVFWCYQIGLERWVPKSELAARRAVSNQANKAINRKRRQDPTLVEKDRERRRDYQARNRAKLSAYATRRRNENPNAKIASRFMSRVNDAMKCANVGQRARTAELLGCSIPDFRAHLERQFTDGMNWDRFLDAEIEIDHIIPLASFDLTDTAQQKMAFNFRNCRPLWEPDNRAKSDRIQIGDQVVLGRHLRKQNIIPFQVAA